MTVIPLDRDATQASALWDELRSALANFERVLTQIVETRAWEPLGYANFAEAWQDRMRGTRLATAQAAATVVYGLLDAGVPKERIPDVLGPGSNVGPAKVAVIARQRDNGVPASIATDRDRRAPQPFYPATAASPTSSSNSCSAT